MFGWSKISAAVHSTFFKKMYWNILMYDDFLDLNFAVIWYTATAGPGSDVMLYAC